MILLCKVETRSGIDNLLNINVALMSTLHNDMLVIICVFGIQPDTALIDKIFKELILFTARAA